VNRPLSLNRWMYVEGNPINYIDPSGHFSTLAYEQISQVVQAPIVSGINNLNINASNTIGSDCLSLVEIGYGENLIKVLKKRYDWDLYKHYLSMPWSDYDVLAVFNTANDIEKYVDNITGGEGRHWMRKYLGGITITIEGTDRGFGIPYRIGLPSWLSKSSMDRKKYYLAHELGHIWDAHTGQLRFAGIIGGVADDLNTFIIGYEGGTNFIEGTTDSRFNNPGTETYVDPHIPTTYKWYGAKWSEDYGNGATADYLAEAFAYSVYDKNAIPGGASGPVAKWVDARIYVEAVVLPH
jgi:hypothetical protein